MKTIVTVGVDTPAYATFEVDGLISIDDIKKRAVEMAETANFGPSWDKSNLRIVDVTRKHDDESLETIASDIQLDGVDQAAASQPQEQDVPEAQPMTQADIAEALAKLRASGLSFSDCINAFGVARDENPYARAADAKFAEEGVVEFDDTLVIAKEDGKGAYVMSWHWVSDEDAGVGVDAFLSEFDLTLDLFKETHEAKIDALEKLVSVDEDDIREFFREQVDNLKSRLGADAANACGDDEDQQNETISAVEEWVSDNISDNPTNEIAATLWLLGAEDGEMAIINAIKSSASKKSPATE